MFSFAVLTRNLLRTVLVLFASLIAATAVSVTHAMANAPSAVVPQPALAPGGSFVPVSPTRLIDTRRSGGPVQQVSSSFTAALGVPASAVSAVLVNVTVVDAVSTGYLQLTPGGDLTGVSNGNFAARTPSASLTLLGTYGSSFLQVLTSVRANIVVDLQGYVTSPEQVTADSFTPIPAFRVADSRSSAGLTTFTTGRTQTLDVRGRGGLPATATAVIANVTIASTTAPTYLTAWSGAGARPTVSNVNAGRGEIVANRTLLPLDADGRVSVFNASGRTDVVVDVVGWVGPSSTGSYYTPGYGRQSRARLGDSGNPVTSLTVSVAIGPVNPSAASRAPSTDDLSPTTAVWLALAADRPAGRGYLTAGPGGATPGRTSDLNLVPSRAVANSGPVLLAADGTVTITASANTRIIVDSSGWFQQPPAAPAAPGLWSTYAPAPNSITPLVSSTVRTALPSWFATGIYGATPLGGGVASATAIAPDGTVWRAIAPSAYAADTNHWTEPQQLAGLAGITDLATAGQASTSAVYALRNDGAVLGYGRNTDGEIARQPSPNPIASPVRIPLPQPAVRIGASTGTGYAVLADGTVWSWGANTARLGRPTTATPWVPHQLPGLSNPVAISGDSGVAVAIDADGSTSWWGDTTGVPATPTAVKGTGICPTTTALHVDAHGVFELCSDSTATRVSDGRLVMRLRVAGSGFIALSASTQPVSVRVLFADGRVADTTPLSISPYEAGFAKVTAIGGTNTVSVTLVAD